MEALQTLADLIWINIHGSFPKNHLGPKVSILVFRCINDSRYLSQKQAYHKFVRAAPDLAKPTTRAKMHRSHDLFPFQGK